MRARCHRRTEDLLEVAYLLQRLAPKQPPELAKRLAVAAAPSRVDRLVGGQELADSEHRPGAA
jgi:hypothetical protein